MRASIAIALFASAFSSAPVFGAPQASFDCARANSRVEKQICADAELATLDRHLSAYYQGARSAFVDAQDCLRADQRRWMREVRDRCDTIECLTETYLRRLAELEAVQPGAAAITYRELPDAAPLVAIIPKNGDAQFIPEQPTRNVQFAGRYTFDADYGPTFIDEQQRRYVLTALNQSLPEMLTLLDKQRMQLVVRGSVLQAPPDPASYPDVAPPYAEFDPRSCVFVHQLE